MQPLRLILAFAIVGTIAVPSVRAAEGLPFGSDFQKALESARKTPGKRVFIDFTGDG